MVKEFLGKNSSGKLLETILVSHVSTIYSGIVVFITVLPQRRRTAREPVFGQEGGKRLTNDTVMEQSSKRNCRTNCGRWHLLDLVLNENTKESSKILLQAIVDNPDAFE